MEQPFIYKYQPRLFKDFEIEENTKKVISTLININLANILLTGDTGCGKTSLIYAIIREYYKDTPYTENILSINNLKEQGITYYRNDVKTFCQTSCTIPGKKKIIILDDIDIINEQSQQVFRNCIDKYSDNVCFLASCNNTQKVIESLQSRLSIIKIKTFSRDNFIKIMKRICDNEKIFISLPAQKFILSISNNSVRILINYLEKLKLLDCKIDLKIANRVCTNIPFHEFTKFTINCRKKNLTDAIKQLYKLYDNGYSVMDILDTYFLFIKNVEILNEEEKYKIIYFISKYITIFHNIHEDEIELALFTNNIIDIFS